MPAIRAVPAGRQTTALPRVTGVAGNRAIGALLQRATLAIGRTGDRYEQEADRVAARVMRIAVPAHVQRTCTGCEEPDQTVQRRVAGAGLLRRAFGGVHSLPQAPSAVTDVLGSGGGEPLPGSARAFFEPRFGHDFGQVRVHTGARGAASAAAVNALAYTVGHHIVFASGQFAPGTAAGRALLAHELTHVVQQGLTRSLPPHVAPGEGDPAKGAPEQAAERPAAARRGLVSVGSVEAQVQRQTAPGVPPRFQRGCDDLLAEIIARVIELKERAQALIDNPFNLPPTGPMSVAGHQQQFANKQVNLRRLLNDWNTNNCGGPGGPRLPADAWSWATRPVPSPAPSRAPRVVTEPRREPIVTPERVGAAVGIGVGLYVAYRVIRMLPSLLPPLWWTIPANVAVP